MYLINSSSDELESISINVLNSSYLITPIGGSVIPNPLKFLRFYYFTYQSATSVIHAWKIDNRSY